MLKKQHKIGFLSLMVITTLVLAGVLNLQQQEPLKAQAQQTPAAACNDSVDNDNDGLTDFPNDPGCNSSSDNDETDVSTSFNTGSGVSSSGNNTYPIGIEVNSGQNIYVRARVGNRFEMVQMTPTPLPSDPSRALRNAEINDYLLRGVDSSGVEHLAVVKGRHWDTSTFSDDTITAEPWHSYFTAGTDLASCAEQMSIQFSNPPFYLDDPFFFQQMLEMITLCSR